MSTKRKISFGLLIAGGCFLWNPVVGVTDPLPDLIGYLLLCAGIARLADLNDDLAETQKAFRAMLWVGMGQLVALLLTKVVLGHTTEQLNRYEQPVWVLLFAFVFLVLEWYFLIPAWHKFFKGLSALAEFGGGTAILTENRRGQTLCNLSARACTRFVILQSVLTLLPELTVLASFERDAENPMFLFDWFKFIDLFRTVAALLSFVVGLVWLIRYLRIMIAAQRDTAWREALQERYASEILPDIGLLLNRRVNAAFAFFRVGCFFIINLSLSYFEFLPDWFSVVLFFCGCLMLGSLLEGRGPCTFCGLLLTLVGVARTVLNVRYLKSYIPQDALRLPDAYEQYRMIQLLGVAEAVLSLVFVLLLMHALFRMEKRYVQVAPAGETDSFSERANERLRLSLRKKALPVYIFLVFSAVGKIAELYYQQTYGWFWTLQFLISFTAAIFFSAFLTELSEQIAETYPKKRRV